MNKISWLTARVNNFCVPLNFSIKCNNLFSSGMGIIGRNKVSGNVVQKLSR